MSTIVIRDLEENSELDNAAMRSIFGGNPGHGVTGAQARLLTLRESPLQAADDFLPRIGLGLGFLGSVDFS